MAAFIVTQRARRAVGYAVGAHHDTELAEAALLSMTPFKFLGYVAVLTSTTAYSFCLWWKWQRLSPAERRRRSPGNSRGDIDNRHPWLYLLPGVGCGIGLIVVLAVGIRKWG